MALTSSVDSGQQTPQGAGISPDSQSHKHTQPHGHEKHTHVHDDTFACACGDTHDGHKGHSHSGVGLNFQLSILVPVSAALLILAGILYQFPTEIPVAEGLGFLAALIAGGPISWEAVKGISRGQTNVNELVALSIIGALALGEIITAGVVALIMQLAAAVEQVAADGARNAILALQDLTPKHARVRRDGRDVVIASEELQSGDTLVIRPGERIAGDGEVLTGSTTVDESMVTGESLPAEKEPGATVLAGSINLTGSAEVRVTRVGEQSALGQTIELVRSARQYQPPVIRIADRFFSYYTVIVLGLSALAWWVTKTPSNMVAMWVVGCPCAMLFAGPIAVVVTMARAGRGGIQVKAVPFVEASAHLDTVAFDKTGTLTTGKFIVRNARPMAGISEEQLLGLAAAVENRSSHPLAQAILTHVRRQNIAFHEAADVKVLEGLGVEAQVNGRMIRAGSAKILPAALAASAAGLEETNSELPLVPVYVMQGEQLLGAINLTDEIRPEARRTIKRLRSLGVKRIVMMTGDRRKSAQLVGRAVGCDDVYAELLPGQKEELIRQLQRGGHGVGMVGDGINDAPSLAVATVGIAMGIHGTDVAMEAADAVLLKDDLTRIPLLIYLARQTRTAIFQNLSLVLVINIFAEIMAATGVFSIIVAAIVHYSAVLVIAANSVRLAGDIGVRLRPLPAVRETPAELTPPASAAPLLQTA